MILPNDEDTIRRMLGTTDIPESIAAEYEKWLRMHHRDGSSGSLGHILCLCLLRHLGLEPPKPVAKMQDVDWRSIPLGTRVVVKDGLQRLYGTYRGKVDYGTVGVMLDNSPFVQEINARMVELHSDLPADVVLDEFEDVAYETFTKRDVVDIDDGPNVDWSQYKRGQQVWVDDNGQSVDGTFWQAKDGMVVVKVGAEKVSYPADQVVPAT